jgi:enoyl-CoA hydratase/carnithine racemase
MSSLQVTEPSPGVRLLTLDRPERLNALSRGLIEDLHGAFDDLEGDTSCRIVVLTGAGRGFCSGLDLKEVAEGGTASLPRGPAAGMRAQARIADLVLRMRAIPQPVIAAVNGPAYGGGMALALASDIRLAGRSARLCTQFIRVGLSGCDIGISYLLPKLVGAARAHELILTARQVDAAEAAEIGLVARLVDDDALLSTALEITGTVLGYSPFGVTMTKEVMWANLDAPSLASAIHLENRTQILASTSGDIADIAASFGSGSGRRP